MPRFFLRLTGCTIVIEGMKTEIHSMAIERDWLDGLKAINELFEHAQGERLRWCRIGKGLLAGRSKCPANLDYHNWLDQTGYRSIARNERQDAMWLTVNASIALPSLEETRIGNPEWARRHIRENLSAIYAQCTDARSFTESSVNEPHPASTPEQPQMHRRSRKRSYGRFRKSQNLPPKFRARKSAADPRYRVCLMPISSTRTLLILTPRQRLPRLLVHLKGGQHGHF